MDIDGADAWIGGIGILAVGDSIAVKLTGGLLREVSKMLQFPGVWKGIAI